MPKRSADSRFLRNESSRKLVLVILRSAYSFRMNSVACPDGSMISGYLFVHLIILITLITLKNEPVLFTC